MSSPGQPRPTWRERLEGLSGLKAQLLLAFCSLAVVPALLVMVMHLRSSERTLVRTVHSVTDLGRQSLESAGRGIAASALQILSETSNHLISLSDAAISRNSDALLKASENRLSGASQQVIDLSLQTNQQLSRELVGLSNQAESRLSDELIGLSSEANRSLTVTTSHLTERALQDHTKRLVDLNDRLADDLSDYLARSNQQAAKEVSQRLLGELEREPLVNFRLLAQIVAQTFAGGRLSDRRDAYITVVNRKGKILASTRYQPGTYLTRLAIVQRALHDPAGVAQSMPLIRYRDGSDRYLGVYARRDDGGAVIVSYSLVRAQADQDALGTLVDGSLDNLVTRTTAGTRRAIAATTPRMLNQASAVTRDTVETISRASEKVERELAGEMASRSAQVSRASAERMTAQATRLTARESDDLHLRSQAIIKTAIAEMAPIGQRSAKEALEAMRPQARAAVESIRARLPGQIDHASAEAGQRMLPEARAALEKSRTETLWIGIGLLLLAAALGVGASIALSGRIADPIEVDKKLKQAELDRMGQEMAIATRIQTALVPTDHSVEGYDLTMAMVTASEVGGDLIDYRPRPDGRFWLAVGDVTGHGLTPGLVMMMAQSIFTSHILADDAQSPGELLVRINAALHENVRFRLQDDNYMTLQLIHHLGDGEFLAAGLHCDILVYRAERGEVEVIETPGFFTGFVADVGGMMSDGSFRLDPEDVMLLYTDGLIEARNAQGEQYDMARLTEAFARLGSRSVSEIQAGLLEEVRGWMDTQDDDISLVILRRHPAPVPAMTGRLAT